MKLKTMVIATLALGLSTAVLAQSIGKPEDQIRWRQSGYQFMSWNMQRIKANLDGTYNKEQVIQAANTVAAIANSGMGALYGPGTEKGSGWHETNVKPEFFQQDKRTRLGEVAGAFNKEANELAKVAASGDAAAVKAQFGKLGGACKGCHDDFRKEIK